MLVADTSLVSIKTGVIDGTTVDKNLDLSVSQVYSTTGPASTPTTVAILHSATQFRILQTSGNSFLSSSAYPFSQAISFSFTVVVPIAGWSSSVQMADSTSTRVVAARAVVTTGVSTAGSGTAPINFETVQYDTHAAITPGVGTWRYTAPVSGHYKVSVSLFFGGIRSFGIYKNGSMLTILATTQASAITPGSSQIFLSAGEYIDIRFDGSAATPSAAGGIFGTTASTNYFTIERISGPSQIASSETVAASYYVNAGVSTTSANPINYDTRNFDTHNAVTTGVGAWRFTAPVSGLYSVVGRATNASGSADYTLFKNGTAYQTFLSANAGSTAMGGGASVSLNTGEYIEVRPSATVTPSGISGTNQLSHISITRIGNRG